MKLISPPSTAESSAADGGSARGAGSRSVEACGAQDSESTREGGSAAGALPAEEHSKKCKRICMFMFKGGVYKTSTSIHAAAALAGVSFN